MDRKQYLAWAKDCLERWAPPGLDTEIYGEAHYFARANMPYPGLTLGFDALKKNGRELRVHVFTSTTVDQLRQIGLARTPRPPPGCTPYLGPGLRNQYRWYLRLFWVPQGGDYKPETARATAAYDWLRDVLTDAYRP